MDRGRIGVGAFLGLSLLAALAAGSAQAAINGVPVNNPGPDVGNANRQTTSSVAVDGRNVVVAFDDNGSPGSGAHGLGWSSSANSAAAFTDRGNLQVTTEGDGGHPVLAWLHSSHRLLMAAEGTATKESIWVWHSTTNGATMTPGVNGAPGYVGSGDDLVNPWLAVDNATGPGTGNGNAYLCFTDESATDAEIRFTRATDSGFTFGPSGGTLISSGGDGCQVVVGPGHELYVFYLRGTAGTGLDSGDNKLYVRRSLDEGQTFQPEHVVADLQTTTLNGDLGLANGLTTNSFPQAAINPVTDDAIVTFNDDSPAGGADHGDIFRSTSLDGGSTWSPPQKVNDDLGRDQYGPTVSIDPSGKRIMFGYSSNSHDVSNVMLHRRARAGVMRTDASLALRPSFQLGPDTPPFAGVSEYDGLTADRSTFYSTWADSRQKDSFNNNQPDVRIARIATSGPVTPGDVGVEVHPVPSSVGEQQSLDVRLEVSAFGDDARDVYVSLLPTPGLRYADVDGGSSCKLINGFVGCSLGTVLAETTVERTVRVSAGDPGTRTLRAKVTTADWDFAQVDNDASASLTVNALPSITQNFSTGNLSTPIPDSSTVDIPLNVGPVGNVIKAEAYVRLNHTFDSDLNMFLIAPGGQQVELSTGNGFGEADYGSGPNNCAGTPTHFVDGAPPIEDAAAPFAGDFGPEGALSDLFGAPEAGTWKLRITDTANQDVGTVGCFKLRIRRATP